MVQLVYTPIIIEWVSPIKGADGYALPLLATYLTIKSPLSRLPNSVQQSFPREYKVPIPADGRLAIELLSSNNYHPRGEYEVTFFNVSDPYPFLSQEWLVPAPLAQGFVTVRHTGQVQGDLLGQRAYNILNVSREGKYVVKAGHIIWLENPPTVGEEYTVTYSKAYFLHEIIKPNPKTHNSIYPKLADNPYLPGTNTGYFNN